MCEAEERALVKSKVHLYTRIGEERQGAAGHCCLLWYAAPLITPKNRIISGHDDMYPVGENENEKALAV